MLTNATKPEPFLPNITYITLNIIEYLADKLTFYYTLLLINITFIIFMGNVVGKNYLFSLKIKSIILKKSNRNGSFSYLVATICVIKGIKK